MKKKEAAENAGTRASVVGLRRVARCALFRRRALRILFGRHFPGIGYADMQQAGIYAPMYDLHIKYYAPLCMNDVAIIHTYYIHKPGARLDFHYKIFRESDNTLCAEGDSIQLFIDDKGELMTDVPEYYKTWQEKYL